jgi:hypothetical protein
MSGSDKMDSILECVVTGARGFLLLHPVVTITKDRRYPRPKAGDAYPQRGGQACGGSGPPPGSLGKVNKW